MQFAIPQLTTIVLLVHMGLGCCWHHAHLCATGYAEHGPRVEDCTRHVDDYYHASHPGRCDHAQRDHSCPHEGEDDPHRGHDHQCEGDRCTFVRSRSSFDQSKDLVVNDLLSLPAAVTLNRAGLDHARFLGNTILLVGKPSLPLRAHLLFRVLLI